MSKDDRVGARPLSAFQTADICADQQREEDDDDEEEEETIGITALNSIVLLSATTTTTTSSEHTDAETDSPEQQHDSSILMASHDVFGLLQDPHADPPIETKQEPSQEGNPYQEDDDATCEEFHSPLDEEEDRKPMMTASPYDYDVNWDMVGQLRRTHDDKDDKDAEDEKEETDEQLNTTSCSSLADAAAASMLASNSSAVEEEEKPKSFFRPRRSHAYSYKYQKSSSEDQQDTEEQQHNDAAAAAEQVDQDETGREANDFIVAIAAVAAATTGGETPSEMNESIHTTASTSSSSGNSMTHRRRQQQNQRRYPRAASAPLTTPSIRTRRSLRSTPLPSSDEVRDDAARTSSSSLDSGMAAVRRWIRSRSAGSSRAARRWQREHDTSTLQLGEEDIFALTNAGEDPRGRQHYDDASYQFRSPLSILEEEAGVVVVRQRALSEPDGMRLRNFFFQRAAHGPSMSRGRSRRGGGESSLDEDGTLSTNGSVAALSNSASVPTHLSSAALNSSLFHSPQRTAARSLDMQEVVASERGDGDVSSLAETSVPPSTAPLEDQSPEEEEEEDNDPNREARTRWIRINRRFQLIITVVALIFSLLLFAILVCWIVFTSAYVVSIEKPCDVPLKSYFWLATFQLILDVFRTDIMRFVFRWDTHSNERIPARVIAYNIAYLIYALLVLRMGIRSVFMEDGATCSKTAPELYQSAAVFVSLSIAAWSTIVLGYLAPFCFVATLLTWNGYTPSADTNRERVGTHAGVGFGGVFPAAYSSSGAPPGCIDQLRTVMLEEFPEDYPHECCICMGDFVTGEVIVATECQHVFHKRCCQEWLRQARTCPVCRMDIPSSLVDSGSSSDAPVPSAPAARLTRPFPGREDFHQDVVGLLQILRRQEERLRQRSGSTDTADPTDVHEGAPTTARSESTPAARAETEMVALEEGRVNRQHSN